MTDTIEKVARAIEKELDRDFEAWVARWTYPGGSYTDAPEPPTSKYTTSPEKIARAAMRAHLEAMLDAARDWSLEKYGRGVGNDGATGCLQAMLREAIAELESK